MSKLFDEDQEHQHPSYGLVQFNRVATTSAKLFGSAIKTHFNTLRLRIYENVKLIRGQHGDRYYTGNVPSIEVELSAAQFAELITTMNVGFGSPCTIRYSRGKQVENPPELATEAEHVHKTFEDRMKEASKKLAEHVHDLPKKLEEAKIPKKHWETILGPIRKMLQEVGTNSPYWLECFEESTEKVVSAAKAEIEAFQQTAITNAGLRALAAGDVQPEQLALGAKKETE